MDLLLKTMRKKILIMKLIFILEKKKQNEF